MRIELSTLDKLRIKLASAILGGRLWRYLKMRLILLNTSEKQNEM